MSIHDLQWEVTRQFLLSLHQLVDASLHQLRIIPIRNPDVGRHHPLFGIIIQSKLFDCRQLGCDSRVVLVGRCGQESIADQFEDNVAVYKTVRFLDVLSEEPVAVSALF